MQRQFYLVGLIRYLGQKLGKLTVVNQDLGTQMGYLVPWTGLRGSSLSSNKSDVRQMGSFGYLTVKMFATILYIKTLQVNDPIFVSKQFPQQMCPLLAGWDCWLGCHRASNCPMSWEVWPRWRQSVGSEVQDHPRLSVLDSWDGGELAEWRLGCPLPKQECSSFFLKGV